MVVALEGEDQRLEEEMILITKNPQSHSVYLMQIKSVNRKSKFIFNKEGLRNPAEYGDLL